MSSVEENIEISRPSQETPSHPLDDVKALPSMIQRLTNELDAARPEVD
jgi:hypothetical protein